MNNSQIQDPTTVNLLSIHHRFGMWALTLACSIAGWSAPSWAQQTRTESNVESRQIGGQTVQSEREEQQALFNYYFAEQGLLYETRLESLKEEASVPDWRKPYAAAIHPESRGGMSDVRGARSSGGLFGRRSSGMSGGSSALNRYDLAFHDGQDLANSFEIRRIMGQGRALFPALRMRAANESWEGYCSGFTASTIRHPEPVRSVDAGDVGGKAGVVFQPGDIKALLTCIYNRTTDDSYLYLAPPSARDGGPNMGTFHLSLCNYIGQAGHPIGIDRTKGTTTWNNPIYAYDIESIEDAGSEGVIQYKDVQTTITYTYYGDDSQLQTDVATGERRSIAKQQMTLRYRLAVNELGEIVGGRAHNSAGHFLWIPLYAVQAKSDGSLPGNPHLDVRNVIALARAAAVAETQENFDRWTIGPRIDPALTDPPQDAEDDSAE